MLEKIRNHELCHSNLRLEKINTDNYYALAMLSVAPDQTEHLAPNWESMASALATQAEGRYAQVLGIFDGDTPVGFTLIGHNSFVFEVGPEVYRHSYDLWRFMIDQKYQGRGYGRDALKLIVDFIRTFPDGEEDVLATAYVEGNDVAKHLFLSSGFVPNGETCKDEVVLVLPLK